VRAICFDVTVAGYLRARAMAKVWPTAMLGRHPSDTFPTMLE